MIQQQATITQYAQNVVVTGASSGIGREIAIQLASRGIGVIAIGRDEGRLQSLAASRSITPVVADLARTDLLAELSDNLLRRFGAIDALVNNAAIQFDCRMDEAGYSVSDAAREIAINLTAPIALTRCLLPHLQTRPRASIVNITTGLAFVPKRTAAVYSASKAGLHLFTEALRVQFRGTSVRVVECVMPLVDTPMTAGRGSGKITPAAAARPIVDALWSGPSRLHVGKARLLPPLLRIAPGIAARILQRT